MTYSTIGFVSLIIILLVSLCMSLYYNIKFGILIIKLQDSIEDSLDILDKKYKNMSDILEIPVFFDSVEVRKVISDIQSSKDSILKVANLISEPFSPKEEIRKALDDKKED